MRTRSGVPGLTWRANKNGTSRAYWIARQGHKIDRKFKPRTQLLWVGIEPTDDDIAMIESQCRQLQAQLYDHRWRPTAKYRSKGIVYFIEAAGLIKIGSTDNIATRFQALQNASPVTLKLLGIMDGGQAKERALHFEFKAYRVRGEWFELSPEIKAFVEANATKHEQPTLKIYERAERAERHACKPLINGAPEEIRTPDPQIRSQ